VRLLIDHDANVNAAKPLDRGRNINLRSGRAASAQSLNMPSIPEGGTAD